MSTNFKLDVTADDVAVIIKRKIEEEVGKEFDLAIKRLEDKKNEVVSGILIGLMKVVNMEQRGENLIVTIREINKESK